jgi:hypothetical protein
VRIPTGIERPETGNIPSVATNGRSVLLVASRQPDFAELLEDAGFRVDVRTRPIEDFDAVDHDVAVVFRGRMIGRQHAAQLAERGVPVIEVLTVEPPSKSTANWVRLSNRIPKSDLVQVVQATADRAVARATATAVP